MVAAQYDAGSRGQRVRNTGVHAQMPMESDDGAGDPGSTTEATGRGQVKPISFRVFVITIFLIAVSYSWLTWWWLA